MRKSYKKGGIILIIVIVLFIIGVVGANVIIEKKLINYLKKLPSHINLEYADLDVGILRGNLKIVSPKLKISGQTTDETILSTHAEKIEIVDAAYFNYLFNNKINIGALRIDKPIVKYVHNELVKQDKAKNDFFDKINQTVKIEVVSVVQADLLILNHKNDSLILSAPKSNLEINNLQLKSKSENDQRLSVEGFIINSTDLKYALSEYDNLYVDSLSVSNSSSLFQNLKIQTKYNKAEFSKILTTERDHFNIDIEDIKILGQKLNATSGYGISATSVLFERPRAHIYRDKLVANDLTQKPLYGKMLRDLKFKMAIDTVTINNGEIIYSEKVKPTRQAGTIRFKNFDASILNVKNNPDNLEDVDVEVNTVFMENSPLKVKWNFKVQDSTDHFMFRADLDAIQASDINSFSEPNLNTRFKGQLQQTYFTIDGNSSVSRIDLKMKYDNFKVLLLKDDGTEKNKFLSGLINLFISNDSEEEGYRYGQADQVKRDKTKSVFNFIWISLRAGLKSAIADNGKKDK